MNKNKETGTFAMFRSRKFRKEIIIQPVYFGSVLKRMDYLIQKKKNNKGPGNKLIYI